MRKWIYTGAFAVLFIIAPICDAVASSFSVIDTFTAGTPSGEILSGLTVDSNGALYGITPSTIFKLTPTNGGTQWVQTTLYTFTGTLIHCYPNGLAINSNGTLYGTTTYGRKYTYSQGQGDGIVFKLTPPTTGQGAWTFAVLHEFRGGLDGANPMSGVIVGANNVIYGTTAYGGHHAKCNYSGDEPGCGTIFALTPSPVNQGSYTYRVIYRFNGKRQGGDPVGTLYQDSSGNLYGTTLQGGPDGVSIECLHYYGTSGCGTVFQLTPPTGGALAWHENTIYRFDSLNGAVPEGGVIGDSSGAIYGTTQKGGSKEWGTVFKLVPPLPGRALWTRDLSYDFKGSIQGYFPNGLTMGSTGILYGTTYYGGAKADGTVFSLNPNTKEHKVLYSFTNGVDGAYPSMGLVEGPDGALYGTTRSMDFLECGEVAYRCGKLFKLVP